MSKVTKEEVFNKLKTLPIGVLMLMSARKVEDDSKLQLEFAEVIRKPVIKLVGLFNASDSRFTNANTARRGWITVTKVDFKAQTGIDLTKYEFVEETVTRGGVEKALQIAYIGLTGLSTQGYPMHLMVTETLKGTEYQTSHLETSAKQNGQGEFLLIDGKPIFTNVQIVGGEPKHILLDHNEQSKVVPTYFNVIADDEIEEEEVVVVEEEGADPAKSAKGKA